MKGFLAGATVALSIARQINNVVLSESKFGAEVRKKVMRHIDFEVLVLMRKEIEEELGRRLRT